jgi:tRNA pseudouridine13 synthase
VSAVPEGPVLKHRPSDFLVRENLVVELTGDERAEQHYLVLRKCGYTTMEAVRLLADKLGLATAEITFAGLKDEDGVTEQLVAVPSRSLSTQADGEGWPLADEPGRWIRLHHYGYGHRPLEVGGLEGNGFRIVLRGLDDAAAARLEALRKVNLLFVNYYDTQRFGVPGGPKLTHTVGAAVLAGDWERAREQLVRLGAPESATAREWRGSARELFDALDARTTAFYLAAHESHRWNAAVGAEIARLGPDDSREIDLEGLAYRYPLSSATPARLMAEARDMPYAKYRFTGGEPVARTSTRPTVVQTTVTVGTPYRDGVLPGAAVVLGLFLPSGCYATAAIRQLSFQLGLGTGGVR